MPPDQRLGLHAFRPCGFNVIAVIMRGAARRIGKRSLNQKATLHTINRHQLSRAHLQETAERLYFPEF